VRSGGVLVRNATTVPCAPGWDGVRDVAVPATDLAKELGQPLGAGMVALGALAAATGVVAVPSLVDTLGDVLPPHRRQHVAPNRACIERGAGWVAELGIERAAAWA
jgi:2-oxoglutarate ferredoxin oxidoreductase subunit gamma